MNTHQMEAEGQRPDGLDEEPDFLDTESQAFAEAEEVEATEADPLQSLLDDTPVAAPTTDSLDDLDALLAESTTAMRDAQAAKAARDRVKRGGLTQRELAEDLERIRAWEAAHEWAAAANAIRFLQQDCECGRSHQIFTGLLRREVHRTMRFSQRWVAVPSALADLPNEVLIARAKVPLCGHCAEGKGWDVTKAMVTEA